MSDEYTPTTEEIREYVEVGGEPRPWLPPTPEKDALRAAAFDRWLVAHDREVAAKAWDEGNAEPGSGLPRCPACDDRTVSQHRRGDVDEWWHDDDGTVICGGSFTDAVWKDHNPYRAALGVPEEAEPGTLAYAQARAEADGSLDSDEDGYDGPTFVGANGADDY